MKYLTQENITFALALFGSFGTVISFFLSLYRNRQSFDISVIDFRIGEKGILCYLMLTNNSGAQLTLTDMSIKICDIYYPVVRIPEIAYNSIRRYKGEITSTHTEYSIAFPIVLPGYYATSGYFYFPLPKGTFVPSANTFSLKVCTSRDNSVEKTLSLNALQ